MTQNYTVVSMFSGCGGMDLGFVGGFTANGKKYAKRPFDIVWANDLNVAACSTYEHNLKHKIRVGSVWDHIDALPEYADLVIGGFPCQDLSVNGKRQGLAGERSSLYRAMIEGIKKTRPKVFVAENVKGLLFDYNKEALRTVICDFEALGYEVHFDLYRAADYGVPQNRERVFIVGVWGGNAEFVVPPPPLKKASWISAKEAISDLACLEEDASINHIWSKANKSPEQGSRRLSPDRPATTIRAECHGNIQFHYDLNRRISMREASRFQSFPDDFIYQAKLRETERMIGNAVPPVLAWHLAKSIKATLDQFYEQERAVEEVTVVAAE